MIQRLSYEKLESALSLWEKPKRNHKIFSWQTLFCYFMLSLFYWSFLFLNLGRTCTNVGSFCWSLCSFSPSIWSIIWCLSPLLSYVILLLFPSKRCLSLDHSFRHMSESEEENACEKWHAGYLLISLLLKSMLSEFPKSILLSKCFAPFVHACLHITSLSWQMTLPYFTAKKQLKAEIIIWLLKC